ncbi:hypothetical protein HEP84_57675 [Streptomyces sp. RLB1-33]|uniref:hypothetical protein n=1 Tax=Streptomyces sp. NBC_01483 TaxID=2903883 RepID=UPI002001E51E|nr:MULTISPECIES: hypothetical protein [unclassified Streptomyces]
MIVVPASVHDNAIGITLLDQVAADNPSVTKGWVNAGFKNAVIDHGAALGIDIEVVQRDPHTKDFAPAPKRWIVEQTLCATRRSVCIPGSAGRNSEGGSWAR